MSRRYFSVIGFLSGAGLGAFAPTSPPASNSGGFAPTSPPASNSGGFAPTSPPLQGGGSQTGRTARSNQAWRSDSQASLLAQALRKSRAKILRPADPPITPAQINSAQVRGEAIQGSNLLRWAPEFRVQAVAHELISRFQVHGLGLWIINPGMSDGALALSATEVFAMPPSPEGLKMDEQVDKVLRAAAEREDRMPEILSQSSDFWPFFESVVGLSPSNAPRLGELLAVAYDWALHLLMQLKHEAGARRPVQLSTMVMPVISTPGHGSIPSGHATIAALTSELLHILLYRPDTATVGVRASTQGDRSEQLDRLARRIAFNRVVAGVHFPVDSQAGYALGTQLARLLAALAGVPGITPAPLRGTAVLHAPFELPELVLAGRGRPAENGASYPLEPADALSRLWSYAKAETDLLRI